MFFFAICLFAILNTSIYAYIDPGTGSIILQATVAALLSALYAIKNYWHIIKNYFSKFKRKK